MSNFVSSFRFSRAVMEPLLDSPESAARIAEFSGLSKAQKNTRYSFRTLRYLIPRLWLRSLRKKLGRPLRVCEIGIGSGQMKKFSDAVDREILKSTPPEPLSLQWDGFTKGAIPEMVETEGYDKIEEFDADAPFAISFAEYDVVLLLHVLEHLKDPEKFLHRLAATLSPGALVIGGVPSVSPGFAGIRERQLQKKYKDGGHWCKFSASRVKTMLKESDLTCEEITGAFLIRQSGHTLENRKSWMQWNLFFAHLLPSWPGETYFQASKPADPGHR